MQQIGLFDGAATAVGGENHNAAKTAQVGLSPVEFYPDFYSWWQSAKQCVQNAVDPAGVWWTENHQCPRATRAATTAVHAEFVQQAKAACCHRNDDRWALLYRILWRLCNGEPQLLELTGDPDVARLYSYAKAVARDVHKMKAFVRFREVEQSPQSPRYVAWFEPQHSIVEYAAPFFKRRFANMDWSILTPVGCAHWEVTGELWFSKAVQKEAAPQGDKFEQAWRVYYKSIFNPARLKVSAMQSEMPKKYWKNLPEAKEISQLIASAEARTSSMIAQRKTEDKMRCGARPLHPDQSLQRQIHTADTASLQSVRLEACLCTGCPQAFAATQTVFGEGPEDARLMIIGEQPGDEEDLQGRPFVGPAGRVLDAALKHAGIDREQCYLTNAVKHFGFEARGKQRLHKRPAAGVVSACSQWLARELECVKPDLVVYLGATAASTCFGSGVRINRDRGKMVVKNNRQHLITIHPSGILRLTGNAARQQAYVQFVEELKQCADVLNTH